MASGSLDFLVPLVSLGGMGVVIGLVGLFIRLLGRGLVSEPAVVEQGAGPVGLLVVRWGGPEQREHSGAALYIGPRRGVGEQVTIRHKPGNLEQIEIVGPNTRGVYLFWIAGIVIALAVIFSIGVYLTT